MNARKFIVFAALFFSVFTIEAAKAEQASEAVVKLAQTTIADLGTDPVIVSAVKAENEKGKSMDQIKSMDTKWKATAGIADYMNALMVSACGQRLRALQASQPFFAEIFVMDNQGANVAMSDKTSDYWQGDEAKFQKSFNSGKGAVFVDEVEFDDSAQAYLCQISVPVKDNDRIIGAITVGIDVEEVK